MPNDRTKDNHGRSSQASTPGAPQVTPPWLTPSFLAALERDLLGPLSVVINNMEVHSESTSDAQRSALCTSTQLAAVRLRQTVLRLTDLARLEAGTAESDEEPVALSSLLKEALLSFRYSFPESNHDVSFDANAADVVIVCDRDRLYRLLISLMSVAADALKPGSRLRIRSRYEKQEALQTVRLTVSVLFDARAPRSSLWYETISGEGQPPLVPSRMPLYALYALYARSVAAYFGGSVEADPRKARLRFEGDFQFVRIGPGRERSRPSSDSDLSVAVLSDSLPLEAGFNDRLSDVDIDYRPFASVAEFADSMTGNWPSAVILRQARKDTQIISAAQSIRSLAQGRAIPILLVSISIDYETLKACRRYVNAVLMEPFTTEELRRYVFGMTRPDRRRSRRLLELHS